MIIAYCSKRLYMQLYYAINNVLCNSRDVYFLANASVLYSAFFFFFLLLWLFHEDGKDYIVKASS